MYSTVYDSEKIRNENYNIITYILPYYKKQYNCLDLGCGSCRKIIKLADKISKYYAIDHDKNRIAEAKKFANKWITLY